MSFSSESSGIGGSGVGDLRGSENSEEPPSKKKKIKIVYFDDMDSSTSSPSDLGSCSDSESIEVISSGEEFAYDSSSTSSLSENEYPSEQRKVAKGHKKKKELNKKGEKRKRESKYKKRKEDTAEYFVEKILAMEYNEDLDKTFFLVKWLNYDSEDNTWEPEEHMDKCRHLLEEFYCKDQTQNKLTEKKPDDLKRTRKNSTSNCKSSKKRILPVKSRVGKKKARKGVGTVRNFKTKSRVRKAPPILSSMQTETLDSRRSPELIELDMSPPLSPPPSPSNFNENEKVKIIGSRNISTAYLGPGFVPVKTSANIAYFRAVKNEERDWIYIDIFKSPPDELYDCIVTEDLTGKDPKFAYGALLSVNGDKFCLVQFEGCNYVEVISSENLFQRFPYFRRYFEIICPNVFPSNHYHNSSNGLVC